MAVVYFGARAARSAQPAAQRAGGRGGGAGRRRSAVGGRPGVHPHLRRHARDPGRRAGCRRGSRDAKAFAHAACLREVARALSGDPVSMLAASVAAEALLFPVGALIFSRVTFAGLALNLLAIPLMAVAQIAGMAVVPLRCALESLRPRRRMDRARSAPQASCGRPICVGSRRCSPIGVAPPSWAAVAVYYVAAALGVGALDASGGRQWQRRSEHDSRGPARVRPPRLRARRSGS